MADDLGLSSSNEPNEPRAGWRNLDGLGILNAPNPAPARPNSVIDLTGDDDEEVATAKAIEASMESHRSALRPSNRIDLDQEWAMVPSNAPPILSQEDRALNEALEASLTTSFVGGQEQYEEAPDIADRLRKEGWPFVFRVMSSPHCYVPVILQCLLSIPKIQERLLEYDPNTTADEEVHTLAKQYQRLAALSGHSARAYMAVDELLGALVLRPPSNQDSVATLIRDYFLLVATELERIPRNPAELTSDLLLLTFQGGNVEADVDKASSSYASGVFAEVSVPTAYGSDVVSCLAHSFMKTEVYLTELSEVFTFIVCREDMSQINYPSRIYMDRFLQDNVDQSRQFIARQEAVHHDIQKLSAERQKLVAWKNNDTLKSIRSTVHYFEHLAADGGDPVRKHAHEKSKDKLQGVIKQLESDVEFLDVSIKELTTESERLFTQPELQQHAYDLHCVVIHDGLFGRTHLYSYTKDAKGRWWKIVDYQVTEVTEEMVLNDQTGLHLAAGPILLIYTRVPPIDPTLTEGRELRFPRVLMDLVKADNEAALAELQPEATPATGLL